MDIIRRKQKEILENRY